MHNAWELHSCLCPLILMMLLSFTKTFKVANISLHPLPIQLILQQTWYINCTSQGTLKIPHIIQLVRHSLNALRSLCGSSQVCCDILIFISSWLCQVDGCDYPFTHTRAHARAHTPGLLVAENIINNLHVISFVLIIFVWQSVSLRGRQACYLPYQEEHRENSLLGYEALACVIN